MSRHGRTNDLDEIAALCAGKQGDADGEWSIGYMKGDDAVRFCTTIGSKVSALLRRHLEAILSGEAITYPDGGLSVTLRLDPALCRGPEGILKPKKGEGGSLSGDALERLRAAADGEGSDDE